MEPSPSSAWDRDCRRDIAAKGYKLYEDIGSGTFSVVYRSRFKDGTTDVAVKIIHPTSKPDRILNELKHLEVSRGCPFVVEFMDAFRIPSGGFGIVFPLVPHDDFLSIVKRCTMEDIRYYMRSLLRALAHIHSKGIIHRDVKPKNFLYSMQRREGMLIDLGLAQDMNSDAKLADATAAAVVDGDAAGSDAAVEAPVKKSRQADGSARRAKRDADLVPEPAEAPCTEPPALPVPETVTVIVDDVASLLPTAPPAVVPHPPPLLALVEPPLAELSSPAPVAVVAAAAPSTASPPPPPPLACTPASQSSPGTPNRAQVRDGREPGAQPRKHAFLNALSESARKSIAASGSPLSPTSLSALAPAAANKPLRRTSVLPGKTPSGSPAARQRPPVIPRADAGAVGASPGGNVGPIPLSAIKKAVVPPAAPQDLTAKLVAAVVPAVPTAKLWARKQLSSSSSVVRDATMDSMSTSIITDGSVATVSDRLRSSSLPMESPSFPALPPLPADIPSSPTDMVLVAASTDVLPAPLPGAPAAVVPGPAAVTTTAAGASPSSTPAVASLPTTLTTNTTPLPAVVPPQLPTPSAAAQHNDVPPRSQKSDADVEGQALAKRLYENGRSGSKSRSHPGPGTVPPAATPPSAPCDATPTLSTSGGPYFLSKPVPPLPPYQYGKAGVAAAAAQRDAKNKRPRGTTPVFVSPTNLQSLLPAFTSHRPGLNAKPPQKAERAGTPGFRALEILLRVKRQTTAVDMWSAGVILCSLVCRRYPLFYTAPKVDSHMIAQIMLLLGAEAVEGGAASCGKLLSEHPFLRDRGLAASGGQLQHLAEHARGSDPDLALAVDLVRCCLDPNPHTRYSATQALQHPFLASAPS